MSENKKQNIVMVDLGLVLIIVWILLCNGSPDILDGFVYKLTGVKVWECKDDTCPVVSP